MECAVMVSDSESCIPDEISVPNVRENIALAFFTFIFPKTGMRRESLPNTCFPASVAAKKRTDKSINTTAPKSTYQRWIKKSENAITTFVMPGKSEPISANILANCGNTTTDITIITTTATTISTVG